MNFDLPVRILCKPFCIIERGFPSTTKSRNPPTKKLYTNETMFCVKVAKRELQQQQKKRLLKLMARAEITRSIVSATHAGHASRNIHTNRWNCVFFYSGVYT